MFSEAIIEAMKKQSKDGNIKHWQMKMTALMESIGANDMAILANTKHL